MGLHLKVPAWKGYRRKEHAGGADTAPQGLLTSLEDRGAQALAGLYCAAVEGLQMGYRTASGIP